MRSGVCRAEQIRSLLYSTVRLVVGRVRFLDVSIFDYTITHARGSLGAFSFDCILFCRSLYTCISSNVRYAILCLLSSRLHYSLSAFLLNKLHKNTSDGTKYLPRYRPYHTIALILFYFIYLFVLLMILFYSFPLYF